MRTIAVLLMVSLGGCAALTMQSPRTEDPAVPPRCSEARGGVVIDGLFVALAGIGTLIGAGVEESSVTVLSLATGAGYLGSAVAGSRSASRCTKAHERHLRWLEEQTSANADRMRDLSRTVMPQGKLGLTCYPNMTCNQGLACDATTKLCVEPPESAAEPEGVTVLDAYPVADSPVEPVDAPVATPTPAPMPAEPAPATRPTAPATRPTEPARPAPPSGNDFWREVPR